MQATLDRIAIEARIREEFAVAFEALEHASLEEKRQANSRLNHAVRRLVDFVAYDKVPTLGALNTGE